MPTWTSDRTIVSLRIDKWLYFSRLVHSRTQAEDLITQGKIRVNRSKILKPSYCLRIGDVITATLRLDVKVVRVRGFVSRRASAKFTKDLYEDLTETKNFL